MLVEILAAGTPAGIRTRTHGECGMAAVLVWRCDGIDVAVFRPL
jgi:hypothetical protein